MPEMMRLKNGEGPEVTVPEWADEPTPEQWLDWFQEQSREGQLGIVEYHLAIERGDYPAKPEQLLDQAMRDLVERDRYETVYPKGVPTQVPRNQCRCPILNVGDFCPVHGG